MAFWLYILRCADGSYYTGHTDNLELRIAQHNAGQIPGCHTFNRRPLTLVFTQDFSTREEALAAECQIKRWRREKKEALIAGEYHRLPELARTAKRISEASGSTLRPGSGSPRTGKGEAYSAPSPSPVRGELVEPSADNPEFSKADQHWMHHALTLADRAERENDEIPVGAVLVDNNGELLGEGWNCNIAEHDPSAHAEIVALRQAGLHIKNHRLLGSTLYVTLEPCAMCAMAMIHARIARVVFAASDPKTGACGSVFDLLSDSRHNHRVQVQGGLMGEEASSKLTTYFQNKRRLMG